MEIFHSLDEKLFDKFEFIGVLLMQCIGTLSPAYAVLIVMQLVPLLTFLPTAVEK